MPEAAYSTPAAFLDALARRLRTTPDRVPAARATEDLLSWLEAVTGEGNSPPASLLRTAARLVYEHARLVIGPTSEEIDALARRLAALNEKRPQAAAWTRSDWRNMARLVLENRRLPTVALFSDHPPARPTCWKTWISPSPPGRWKILPSPPLAASLPRP